MLNCDIYDKIRKYIDDGSLEILYDEPMSRHTTFRIGGGAAIAFPDSVEVLHRLIALSRQNDIPYFVFGNGSNILADDKRLNMLLICTAKLNRITYCGAGEYICDAGAMVAALSKRACADGLSGLEFCCGIPGTVGAGVFMNCGAYGGQMSDVVQKTEYIDQNGEICFIEGSSHEFSYRESYFSKNPQLTITRVWIKLEAGNKEEIAEQMRKNLNSRNASQPVDKPNAGSVFKRTGGVSAGKLIDECGLKGFSHGGAEISEKHANFIVNNGGASYQDVLSLIEAAKQKVMERFGTELECEIRILTDTDLKEN